MKTTKKLKVVSRVPLEEVAVKKVLPYLADFERKFGFMPTLREIAEAFGKTYQWSNLVLKELQKKKLIKVSKGIHRGIRIIQK